MQLSAIAASYSSHARTDRLIFVAETSQDRSVQLEAVRLALQDVKAAVNLEAFKKLVALGATSEADEEWAAAATQKVASRQAKLEADLAESKAGMIKESIRMAHKDIADFFYAIGDLQSAFRSYVRMRDHCSTPNQILAMCLAIIKVAFEVGNHVHVNNYVKKAEDLPNIGADKVTSGKLKCAAAMSALKSGHYKTAALLFKQVNAAMGSEYNDVIAPQDVANAGVLCGLATFNRAEMQEHLIDNIDFREYLESAPQMRLALHSFYNTQYAQCLEALSALRPPLASDPLLADKMPQLLDTIRRRALVQYLAPFRAVDLKTMATAFGISVGMLQSEIAALIVAGEVSARIDSDAGALHTQRTDQRVATYHHVLHMGEQYLRNTKALLLRANLQKHGFFQVPPTPRFFVNNHPGGMTADSGPQHDIFTDAIV